ncbi:hypothetical protein FRC01_007609 [Tulasnella sp. 417]|nr:hypothetical protein FRC01_007609 [Tulasnella sp. 417]
MAPLTEDELTMDTKSRPTVGKPGVLKKASLSSRPPVRPPMNAHLKTKAVKSSVAPSASSSKLPAMAQRKEKENVPTATRVLSKAPAKPVPTASPVKAISGKVVMGRSTSRSTIASLAAKVEKKSVAVKPAATLSKPRVPSSRPAPSATASKK